MIRTWGAWAVACFAAFLLTANATAQTAPNLGTAGTFGAFSGAGAIGNTGLTVVTGDIGTYVGAFTGFPPGIYTGAKHVADPAALTAKNDLILAYNSLNDATHAVSFDTALGATMGNGQVLTPRTYGRSDLTTIGGSLTFDAKGNAGAIFIVKIRAALNVAKNTQILLANGAQAANIYWAVDGAVSILDNSVFKGTILANGAIHLYGGSTLEGRALAVVGAITLASNRVAIPGGVAPGNNLIVITPAPGDTVVGGTQNYEITWGGTGIGAQKTIEYSLDSGATWRMIGTTNTPLFSYEWDVPDSASTRALVRVTDQNDLRGVSGIFTIIAKPAGEITIARPSLGESIVGGTKGYQIVWSGSGIAAVKTFEYSLDNGATWILIGMSTTDGLTYGWDVPDTASTEARVRITDASGLRAVSSAFTIMSSTPTGAIVIVRPSLDEVIAGGTLDYIIRYTAIETTIRKTIQYSLDGGTTWSLVGIVNEIADTFTWSMVPNVATTQALIRITDDNGVSGTSGLFTITVTPDAGSINSITLSGLDNNGSIGNNRTLGISWTYTPDIGTSVNVEYSLDGMVTWVSIGNIDLSDPQSTSWLTPMTGTYNPVFIRVTSSNGKTRTSAPFKISAVLSIASDAAAMGYALSNAPNPVIDHTTISFVLPVASGVTLTIVDGQGKALATIDARHYAAGSHSVVFDSGHLPTGVYAYVLQTEALRLVGFMSVVN